MVNPTVESMDTAVDLVVQRRKRVAEKVGVSDVELKEELAVIQQFRFKVRAFWLLFLSVDFQCSDPRNEPYCRYFRYGGFLILWPYGNSLHFSP